MRKMKQYAAWQAPFYSFWSKPFYYDVAKNWRGLAYGYLFAIICFTWVFMSIKKQMDMTYLAEHDIYPVVEQMPKLTIDNGILSMDKPSPLTLDNTSGAPVITFDTREKPMTLNEAPGAFLVTRDGVYYKTASAYTKAGAHLVYTEAQAKEQKFDFSTVGHQVVDKNSARQFVSDFCRSFALIVFMIAVPVAFVFCVIQTLLYALLGILIARISKIELSYGTLIRLSTVALTPVLIVDSIIKVRGADASLLTIWPIAAMIITVGYLFFAIQANIVNQSDKSEVSGS